MINKYGQGGIGIVSSERNNLSWLFVQSLLKLWKKMDCCPIYYVSVGNIAEARNEVLRLAKEAKLDWVAMIDSDMTFGSDCLLEILKTMDTYNAALGTGLYYNTFPPYASTASILDKDKYTPVTDFNLSNYIDACGMGMVVIKKDLFDIQFEFKKGHGEDYLFCEEVRKKDYSIVLNTDVVCGHLRTVPIYAHNSSIQN